jgi:hypothetical protein
MRVLLTVPSTARRLLLALRTRQPHFRLLRCCCRCIARSIAEARCTDKCLQSLLCGRRRQFSATPYHRAYFVQRVLNTLGPQHRTVDLQLFIASTHSRCAEPDYPRMSHRPPKMDSKRRSGVLWCHPTRQMLIPLYDSVWGLNARCVRKHRSSYTPLEVPSSFANDNRRSSAVLLGDSAQE